MATTPPKSKHPTKSSRHHGPLPHTHGTLRVCADKYADKYVTVHDSKTGKLVRHYLDIRNFEGKRGRDGARGKTGHAGVAGPPGPEGPAGPQGPPAPEPLVRFLARTADEETMPINGFVEFDGGASYLAIPQPQPPGALYMLQFSIRGVLDAGPDSVLAIKFALASSSSDLDAAADPVPLPGSAFTSNVSANGTDVLNAAFVTPLPVGTLRIYLQNTSGSRVMLAAGENSATLMLLKLA